MYPTPYIRVLLAALAVALALYGDTLGGWFLADDFTFVESVHGKWAREPGWFLQMFVLPPEESGPGGFHRPLSLLSWGLDYLAWGTNPIGYRVTNLLMHVCSALLIFRLAWRWTGQRPDIAWLAALLFLVSPLHTEAVAWIAARDETLAALFFLVVLNVLPIERSSHMVLGIVGTLCAFWSKESALMLPPVVTAYHLLVAPSEGTLGKRIGRALRSSLWIWVVTFCYLADRYWILGKFGGTYPGYEPPEYLTLEYIGTRLTYWVLLFCPLEGESFPTWLRWTAGLGTLALVASSFGDRRLRGVVLFLACWTLLAPMPYLWEDVDPHHLEQARHLYISHAPFSILMAIGTARLAGWLLPAALPMRGLFFATLLALLCCATWLTKQAHVRAAELSRRITDEIHTVIAFEEARPQAARPHRLVLENVPRTYRGAHIGFFIVATSRPPFHDPPPFEVEVLDDGFFPLFVVSYLREARDQDKRVVRYIWSPENERFILKPTLSDSVTLRGVVEPAADGFRLRQHDIQLRAADAHVASKLQELAAAGANVELVARVLPSVKDGWSRALEVTTLHRVERILEVPESVTTGSDLLVRVRGRPGSYYLLFEPGLAGFLPLHEYGTLLVNTDVGAFTKGRVPRSGVAVHRIPVPAGLTPEDYKGTIHYQVLITGQDERDPRMFVLTACPGFVVRSRSP